VTASLLKDSVNAFAMKDEIPLFCTQCGATLKESATFCQECGTPVSGTVAGGTQVYRGKGTDNNNGKLLVVTGLLVILAVLMFFFGALVLLDIDGMVNEFMSDPENVQLMIEYGITEELFKAMMEITGYMFVAVGVLALIDAALTFAKRFWGLALALSIILTVVTFVSMIGLLVGIMVIYFQYTAKSEFA
jgi:hypothetical protein